MLGDLPHRWPTNHPHLNLDIKEPHPASKARKKSTRHDCFQVQVTMKGHCASESGKISPILWWRTNQLCSMFPRQLQSKWSQVTKTRLRYDQPASDFTETTQYKRFFEGSNGGDESLSQNWSLQEQIDSACPSRSMQSRRWQNRSLAASKTFELYSMFPSSSRNQRSLNLSKWQTIQPMSLWGPHCRDEVVTTGWSL